MSEIREPASYNRTRVIERDLTIYLDQEVHELHERIHPNSSSTVTQENQEDAPTCINADSSETKRLTNQASQRK